MVRRFDRQQPLLGAVRMRESTLCVSVSLSLSVLSLSLSLSLSCCPPHPQVHSHIWIHARTHTGYTPVDDVFCSLFYCLGYRLLRNGKPREQLHCTPQHAIVTVWGYLLRRIPNRKPGTELCTRTYTHVFVCVAVSVSVSVSVSLVSRTRTHTLQLHHEHFDNLTTSS